MALRHDLRKLTTDLHHALQWVKNKKEGENSPMRRQFSKYMSMVPTVSRDRQGITGLETAIVLIAFVVVSSVFAFAALSTGLFSSDKSKETINAGLAEASGTLEIRGSIIAKEHSSTADAIDEISFQVANAAGGGAVDLTPGETLITYTDDNQLWTLASGDFTVTGLGNADSDKLVEPGEMYEVVVTGLVAKLDPDLGKDTEFTLQLKPRQGAVVQITRTTPLVIDTYSDLG